ncbi:MAG: MoaD/ThiS family protein [Candidatus Heimdallarchaeota archaeon]|nr:MoaD/ThiS family protein [Candidatus Heimdallarchaeota archaeon]
MKTNIKTHIAEGKIMLKEYLEKIGIKEVEKYTILVNGKIVKLDMMIEKDDEIIVVPILKGG